MVVVVVVVVVCLLVDCLVDWLKSCFTSKETIDLLGTGAQNVHHDFHTAREL